MPMKTDREEKSGRRSSRKTSGWGALAKRQVEVAEKKSALENSVRDFWLKDGETAIVQFLQDEPFCYDAHNIKDSKGNWKVVPCQLNNAKHCVLCSDGIKQTWRAAFKVLDYRGNWDKEKSKFKNDEPLEKLWKVGMTVANQIKAQCDKRGKDLTEMVFEVTRSGAGKEASYNFEIAYDKKDRKIVPISHKEEFPTAEELCQPLTDDELDKMGFSGSED